MNEMLMLILLLRRRESEHKRTMFCSSELLLPGERFRSFPERFIATVTLQEKSDNWQIYECCLAVLKIVP